MSKEELECHIIKNRLRVSIEDTTDFGYPNVTVTVSLENPITGEIEIVDSKSCEIPSF